MLGTPLFLLAHLYNCTDRPQAKLLLNLMLLSSAEKQPWIFSACGGKKQCRPSCGIPAGIKMPIAILQRRCRCRNLRAVSPAAGQRRSCIRLIKGQRTATKSLVLSPRPSAVIWSSMPCGSNTTCGSNNRNIWLIEIQPTHKASPLGLQAAKGTRHTHPASALVIVTSFLMAVQVPGGWLYKPGKQRVGGVPGNHNRH